MNQLDEVVKFALYQCRARNNPITETLASYVAQTILNKRTNKFYLEEKLNESELNELKNETLNKLSNQNAPDLKTIQLQIQYDSAYVEMELQRQEKIKKQSNETGKYIDDVVTLEIKNAKDFEGLTTLYTKMFHYLIYHRFYYFYISFLNQPYKNKELIEDPINFDTQAQFNMDKEVGAALESVIPRAALGPFVSLNPSEKVTQLVELANLVIGIRLFNKKIGKGGVSLSSLEDLTKYNARELSEQIKHIALETIEQCEIYTTFFINQDKFQMNNEDIEKYKDELAFLRQYLSYILSLQEDIEQSESMIEQNRIRFIKEMEDLKKLLEHKSSAPKEQVYPKFALLAQSHIGLFEDNGTLQIVGRSKENDEAFYALSYIQVNIIKFQLQKQCKQMETTQQDNLALINYQPESGVQRLLPQNTPDFMQTQLDYFGFCIWSVVKKNGLLIPGKPSLGVFRYRDKNCVFSNEIAINEFLTEPQRYLTGVIDICRQKPHLIRLFRVEENFKNLNLKLTFESGSLLSNKLMVDKDVQTPVHFIEKNLDPNYCWNEWELRRKAIQMANIRKRQTKASQTILSNFKVDSEVIYLNFTVNFHNFLYISLFLQYQYLMQIYQIEQSEIQLSISQQAQVYEMKDQSTSTGQNKGLNPLRPRNYIVGLRDKTYNQQ